MPPTPTHPPPSALRRRLAAVRPGRPTAIAGAIAIALATVGLDAAPQNADTAAGGAARSAQPAAESPSRTVVAHGGPVIQR